MNGAIYILTQDPRYVGLARASAESLKRAMPDLPITVFSQFPIDGPFERVVQVENELDNLSSSAPATGQPGFGTLGTGDGFYDKARFMLQSPYQQTVFLDTDIYVAQPFPELFTLLDHFDFAANHEEYLNTDWFNHYPCPEIPQSFPEFNTGVLAFRQSPAMLRVLHRWCELYRAYRQQHPREEVNDQPFFREAVYYSDARAATLTREYNCKFRGQGYLNGPAKLLHGHVNFRMRPDYMQRVAKIMNRSVGPRVYIGNQVFAQKLVGPLVGRRKANKIGRFSDPDPMIVQRARRLRRIVREQGLRKIMQKFVKAFSVRRQPALASNAPQS